MWLCPTTPRHKEVPDEAAVAWSYGYNIWGVYPQGTHRSPGYSLTNTLGLCGHLIPGATIIRGFPGFAPVRESEVTVPAGMMAIGDSILGFRTLDRWDMMIPARTGRAMARHQGRVNVLFCDGHVESPTVEYLFEDTSDAALTRWNRDDQPHRENL